MHFILKFILQSFHLVVQLEELEFGRQALLWQRLSKFCGFTYAKYGRCYRCPYWLIFEEKFLQRPDLSFGFKASCLWRATHTADDSDLCHEIPQNLVLCYLQIFTVRSQPILLHLAALLAESRQALRHETCQNLELGELFGTLASLDFQIIWINCTSAGPSCLRLFFQICVLRSLRTLLHLIGLWNNGWSGNVLGQCCCSCGCSHVIGPFVLVERFASTLGARHVRLGSSYFDYRRLRILLLCI